MGISKAELGRAIALIETDLVASLQSAGERADRLSMFATYFGQPDLINDQLGRYRAVTVDDVNEFASPQPGENNRATLLYLPRESVESETLLAAAAGAT